ncbi:hypothetical protein [Sporosarcina sp. FSL K6-1508]|uniref:hypothetical protein n=1 Tax=Sporosarcina sp. FSL K6-1508 TaxID=2921553 RepID=UPI0030FA2E96
MLTIVPALEIKAYGVFKDLERAKSFNNNLGDILHLYRIRTTLNPNEFKSEFFKPGSDGSYLEECCGKGNVELEVTKSSFLALHGLTGWSTQRKSVITNFKSKNSWNRGIYKESMLLTIDEIEVIAYNPFKIVLIQNFGEVNELNINEFKTLYYDSCMAQLNAHFGKPTSELRGLAIV